MHIQRVADARAEAAQAAAKAAFAAYLDADRATGDTPRFQAWAAAELDNRAAQHAVSRLQFMF